MRVPRAFLTFLSYPVLSLVFHSCWLRWRWPPTYNCLAFGLRSKAWGQIKQKRLHLQQWHQCSNVHGLLLRWIYVCRSQQSLANWQNSGHGRFRICIHEKWRINTRDSSLESLKEASLLALEWHTLNTCCGTVHKQIPVSCLLMFVESSAIHHSHTSNFYDMQCCSTLGCHLLSTRITVAAGCSCSTLGWALLCPGASPGHLVTRTCHVHNYITHVLLFYHFQIEFVRWHQDVCVSWFYGVFVCLASRIHMSHSINLNSNIRCVVTS